MPISEPLSEKNYLFVTMGDSSFPQITIKYFGWHKCDSTHTNYSTTRGSNTLHIILSGKGYFSQGGKKHELNKNDFFLIPAAEAVSYYPDASDPWEYIWFGFGGKDSENFLREMDLLENPVGTLKNLDRIQSFFALLKDEKYRATLNQFGYYSLFYAILDDLLVQRIFPVRPVVKSGNDLLSKALNYISEHYSSTISVAELSDYLYINRTTLFKAFKKAFGVSPQQYIISYRLRMAQQHICETKLPISVIAEKCGFASYSHFSRLFSSRYGCSPQEMRKSAKFGGVPQINSFPK